MPFRHRKRLPGDISAIFVHAGAGYHSVQNEKYHLEACADAAKSAMTFLKNGGSAVDAVEMAITVLEDREITNAGYGSNLAMDGTVECDATIVDHFGRSGAVGAVRQILNPIHLARLVLEQSTKPLSLRRVPPNLLVGQGATEFAFEQGMPVLPHDSLVSAGARDRWLRWQRDLKQAKNEEISESDAPRSDDSETDETDQLRDKQAPPQSPVMAGVWNESQPYSPQLTTTGFSNDSETGSIPSQRQPLRESASDIPGATADLARLRTPNTPPPFDISVPFPGHHGGRVCLSQQGNDGETSQRSYSPGSEDMDDMDDDTFIDTDPRWTTSIRMTSLASRDSLGKDSSRSSSIDSTSMSPERRTPLRLAIPLTSPINPPPLQTKDAMEDNITDTVGAIAIDCFGNIAAASSSGGIGMKHKGRTGPAALVGIGTAVMPVEPDDKHKTCVAAVTSGTGEHMATTMAASTCASRLYFNHRKGKDGKSVHANEEEAIQSFVQKDFMGHPSVKNSHSAGAIGVMTVKKSNEGVWLHFAHNTDSFAIASMHSGEDRPTCVMSRGKSNNVVTTGARSLGMYKSQLQDVSECDEGTQGEKRRKRSHASSLGYSGYSGFSGANIGSAAGISIGGGCR